MSTLQSVIRSLARIARGRSVNYSIIACVAVFGVIFRSIGIGRSLWLDEAWVANAAISSSLSNVFYYDAWLQTSPPLFMLLVRFTVVVLGLSNWAFRAIPLLMGFVSIVNMAVIARRVLRREYALLAWTMFVLSPTAIIHSATLKQYTAELAASTTILLLCLRYLDRPTAKRFSLLLAASSVGLFIAYSVTFVVPGIVLVVMLTPVPVHRSRLGLRSFVSVLRGSILAVVSAGLFFVDYFWFIAPNTSPRLRAFWNYGASRGLTGVAALGIDTVLRQLPIPGPALRNGWLAFAILGPLCAVGLMIAWLRFRKDPSRWMRIQVVCLLPCLLIVLAYTASAYPLSERTGLFLLPFVVLLIVCSLQLVTNLVLCKARIQGLRQVVPVALIGVTLVTIVAGTRSYFFAKRNAPAEDMASAVAFLRTHVEPGDLLWVHAYSAEGFKLYATVTNWREAPVKFGHTGWPCCPRAPVGVQNSSTVRAIRSDMDAGIPRRLAGKLWLLYTTRGWHWWFVGLDEPRVMKEVLQQRGCVASSTDVFFNVGISSYTCSKDIAARLTNALRTR